MGLGPPSETRFNLMFGHEGGSADVPKRSHFFRGAGAKITTLCLAMQHLLQCLKRHFNMIFVKMFAMTECGPSYAVSAQISKNTN